MIRNNFADLPDLDFHNFKALLDHVTTAYAERTAIRMRAAGGEGYDSYTYRRLGEEVGRCAAFLWSRGLSRGDTVALLAENRPEWCVAYFAVVTTGMIAVPIDSQLHREEVINICRSAGVKAAFVSAGQREKLSPLLYSGEIGFAVNFDGGVGGGDSDGTAGLRRCAGGPGGNRPGGGGPARHRGHPAG